MSSISLRAEPALGEGPILHLLGRPHVTRAGRRQSLGDGGCRVLAYLALKPGEHDRGTVTAALWPDASDGHASGNLRTALWRLGQIGSDLVEAAGRTVALGSRVVVDTRLVADWADRLIADRPAEGDLSVDALRGVDRTLLPGWMDEWVTSERERHRQRVLHALERLSTALTSLGRYAEAIDAALLAIKQDPLRESARRALCAAHLAEGNWIEARTVYVEYRQIVGDELGVAPSASFRELVESGIRP